MVTKVTNIFYAVLASLLCVMTRVAPKIPDEKHTFNENLKQEPSRP